MVSQGLKDKIYLSFIYHNILNNYYKILKDSLYFMLQISLVGDEYIWEGATSPPPPPPAFLAGEKVRLKGQIKTLLRRELFLIPAPNILI